MKTLFILRHAKSSWAESEISDFDRSLNNRGTRSAAFMGNLMQREGYHPGLIISSPAKRARLTAEILKEAGKFDSNIRFQPEIYEASPHTLRNIVAKFDDSFSSPLVIGHNPGIEGFIHYLTGHLEPIPTAALAIIDLEIDSWQAIDVASGSLRKIYRPREEMR